MGQDCRELRLGRQRKGRGAYPDHAGDATRAGRSPSRTTASCRPDRYTGTVRRFHRRSGERDRRSTTDGAASDDSRSSRLSGRKVGRKCGCKPAGGSRSSPERSAEYTTGTECHAGGPSQLTSRAAAGNSLCYPDSTSAGNTVADPRQTTGSERFTDCALMS